MVFSCEICKIFKDTIFDRTGPVAAYDFWLKFSKDSGTKTGGTFGDKYQVQLKKSICCRKNQHLNEKNNSWIYLSFLSVLRFLNFAMKKWFCHVTCFAKIFWS